MKKRLFSHKGKFYQFGTKESDELFKQAPKEIRMYREDSLETKQWKTLNSPT